MSVDSQLEKAFRGFVSTEAKLFPAIVKSVDKENNTIAVKALDGIQYPDVRLKAAIDGSTTVVGYPEIESTVLVSVIGSQEATLLVVALTKIESVDGVIDSTKFNIDKDGFLIQRGKENLKDVINDMIDELNKIVVAVGVTINVAEMTLIKQRLNNILK